MPLDSCSIAVSLHAFKARHLSIYRELWESINRFCTIRISFLLISLDSCRLFTSQNFSFLLQTPFPRAFQPQDHFSCIWYDLYLSFFMHFIFSNLTFGILINFGVFQNQWSFCEIFGMGFVKMNLNHHTLHHICIITLFHAFLDVCLLFCKHVCW